MPFDPLDLILPGVGSALSFGLNTIGANAAQNRTIDNFNMQHQAAIDDWNRNNAYNSPAAQMGRYKDAGLNPNLIYGQMSQAPAVKSADVSNSPQQAPTHVDLSGSLLQAQQVKQGQAQTALLNAQTDKATQEARYASAMAEATLNNMGASTAKSQAETNLAQVNTSQSQSIFPSQKQAAELGNAKTMQEINQSVAQTGSILTGTEIAKAMLQPNIAKSLAETALFKAQAKNLPIQAAQLMAMTQDASFAAKLKEIQSENENYNLQRKLDTGAESHDSWISRQYARVATLVNQWISSHNDANKGQPYRSPLLPKQ